MSSPTERDGRAALAVLGAAVLWGTAGTAAVLGPDEATSWQLASIRLLLGGSALALVGHLLRARAAALAPAPAGRRPIPAPPPRTGGRAERWAGLLAVLTMASFQASYFVAVDRAGVTIGTAVAIGTVPAAAGVLQALILRQRPSRPWWAATIVALVGLALLLVPAADDAVRADAIGVVARQVAG
ncbi:MAG: EamA family transporter, partial [Nitriliruptoraceae bacterium]|nr:EamA family transporter [Nitriliruptoraceae bacterium]